MENTQAVAVVQENPAATGLHVTNPNDKGRGEVNEVRTQSREAIGAEGLQEPKEDGKDTKVTVH